MVSKQNILISILRDPTHLSAQNGIQRTLFLKGRELCIIFWDNSHQNECANFVGLYWVDSATGWPKGSGTVILGGPDNSRVQNQDVRESKDSVRPGPGSAPTVCSAARGEQEGELWGGEGGNAQISWLRERAQGFSKLCEPWGKKTKKKIIPIKGTSVTCKAHYEQNAMKRR